ncbi:intermembrane lipid transfer protein vps13B [Drosophila kikkawai]|uniref:Intermembrane lipid transfer protein vps13B n=1 Tax=Drosophila kikkawai TaxID=30033 RepID=A0A6P4HQ81_DROKI|nr:GPI-anchored hemophore PGA7 [Drosophila kikkawai]
MINAILVLCLLLGSWTQAAQVVKEKDLAEQQDLPRLAGIYVKDGNENGQLRFLGSGLTSSSSTNTNSGLNSAINQYITNKQDILEQLRPTGTSSVTGTGLVTGTTTGTTGTLGTTTGSGVVTTTSNGAIYVNLGNSGSSSSSSSSSSTSATNSAINQAIYGSSPIGDLLPQIVGQAVAGRRRPVNRRRVPAGNRRRVNKRRGAVNNNQIQRRRRRGNNRGKNKAQVMVVRPNRG